MSLKSYGDHFNALTLESWDVPRLLVDPDNRWLAEISRSGPQIITGMRGCGKTMLLRALDIHARAALGQNESSEDVIQRIQNDGFVGLFVSAQRLLDLREQSLMKIEHRLTRLFVTYALQATRALMHVRDLDEKVVAPDAHSILGTVIANILNEDEDLRRPVSLDDLEQKLQEIVVLATGGHERYQVELPPAEVFVQLAESFRRCSTLFESSSVFFLLDDVSTRYLELDKIEALLSSLLFQNPICAFKFTSEWQTIELGLRSPGRNHPIRIGRDLTVFDLGEDVLKTARSKGSAGKDFIAEILRLRAHHYAQHPRNADPKAVLGDVSLEDVAREIASSSQGARSRKHVYRGISCLTAVCVGDIGDIIKLYEEMLKRTGNESSYPISNEIQSKCFREISALRLYDLNRRDSRSGNLKNHAIAFAQTAHGLLTRSYRKGMRNNDSKVRLRQYTSIYVRVTAEDEDSQKLQIDRLRDLIDAGVFVFAGGSPRTKTKDADPVLQFILSYRKIYGLASFIGLADRDRFELSGDDLRNWLELDDVQEAKEILLRNQIKSEVDAFGELMDDPLNSDESGVAQTVKSSGNSESDDTKTQIEHIPAQAELAFELPEENSDPVEYEPWADGIPISIREVSEEDISELAVDSILIGLGFEDRTLASNRLLAKYIRPREIRAIRYPVKGYSTEIMDVWSGFISENDVIGYDEAITALPELRGMSIIDISGLAKPFIFSSVRRELSEKGRVLVCHASAETYYPLQEDIDKLITAKITLAKILTSLKKYDEAYNVLSALTRNDTIKQKLKIRHKSSY